MRCAQVDHRVERFVDGVLDIRLVRRIEAHLRSCTRCAARVDAARALLKGFAAPAERAPPGFAARVMDAVYREALAGTSRLSAAGNQETRPARWPVRVSRRLGLSLVMTAVVLAASLFVPGAAYPRLFGFGSTAAGLPRGGGAAAPRELSAAVQSALDGADSVVRGILNR